MTGALQLTNVSDMQVMEVNGVKTWAVIAKHHPFPSLKQKNGAVRSTDFMQACGVQSDGNVGAKGQCIITICYFVMSYLSLTLAF